MERIVSREFLPGVLGVPGVIPALRDMKTWAGKKDLWKEKDECLSHILLLHSVVSSNNHLKSSLFRALAVKAQCPEHHAAISLTDTFWTSIIRRKGRDHIYGVCQFIEGDSWHRSMENPSCFSAKGRMRMGSTAHNTPQ